MKKILILLFCVLPSYMIFSQLEVPAEDKGLPNYLTEEEIRMVENGEIEVRTSRGIETPPEFDNIRTMAEWEEIQALTIAWTSYPTILKEIVRNAKEETLVIILSENVANTEFYLQSSQGGDPLDNLDNVVILDSEFDSIWMRDYAGNPVYGNEVDDLFMVDWVYNRVTRPDDDASPEVIADQLDIDLYCLTDDPTDLVNTGGNFMSDGFGTVFQSDLILEENEPGNEYDVSAKNEEEITAIMNEWLGVDEYILMPTLPFDNIHHIDMHMKLLDEETILVGDFGNTSDGPQIQANIEYVLSNTTTKWGTPWKIVWIPMIPSAQGLFPDGSWSGPAYRTFTNSIFINKTILVPSYREEYDSTMRRIYAEQLPGYNVVSIDCDNDPDPIIFASGALHCITHSVGVEDPLLISHKPLDDTDDEVNDYLVSAYMNHRSGMSQAKMYWRIEGSEDYAEIAMTNIGGNDWEAFIPAHPAGTTIEYYVHGEAVSGKSMNRPMPAPEGYWNFDVVGELVNIPGNSSAMISEIYPNPASDITVIPVGFNVSMEGSIRIMDAQGKEVMEVFKGVFSKGETKYFFDASILNSGLYTVLVQHEKGTMTQKLIVK